MAEAKLLTFEATQSSGDVSALYLRPRGAQALLILGHGAGAGMRHPFMESLAHKLAALRVATFRYQFPYMEQGKKAPSPQPILLKTVRSAVAAAAKAGRGLPLVAGGKSMGGRMTSLAASQDPLQGAVGLVFFGFPLHAPGKTGSERGDHLSQVKVPMLFLQGTRDKLADLDRMKPLCRKLGKRATLHIVEGGDHSFHVPKRSGRSDDEALDELAATTAAFVETLT